MRRADGTAGPRLVSASSNHEGGFAAWSEEFDFGIVSLGLTARHIDRLWDAMAARLGRDVNGDSRAIPGASALQRLAARVATESGTGAEVAITVRTSDRIACGLSHNSAIIHRGPDTHPIIRVGAAALITFATGIEPPWDVIVGDLSTIGNGTFSSVRQSLKTADIGGRLSAD
jgi:hypothetical protein